MCVCACGCLDTVFWYIKLEFYFGTLVGLSTTLSTLQFLCRKIVVHIDPYCTKILHYHVCMHAVHVYVCVCTTVPSSVKRSKKEPRGAVNQRTRADHQVLGPALLTVVQSHQHQMWDRRGPVKTVSRRRGRE